MHKYFLGLGMLVFAGPLFANELSFDFTQMPTNQPPAGCFSTVGGDGKPGAWKVIMDDVPLAFPPLNPGAPNTAPKAVVAQLDWDAADNRYPLLILGTNTYGDFTFTTRFKIVDGLTEQMAGVAFRMQDEKNYFYVRASAIENTFYFYRVFKGVRSAPIGNRMKFARGVWHELTVECSGPKIHILIDGKEALPLLSDPTFAVGKIAFLTKSDSISYFTETHIHYTPREPFAQTMVRDLMNANHQLLGLKIFMATPQSPAVHLIAGDDEKEIGQPGDQADDDVINRGVNYYRKDKEKQSACVTMPLRDRNGDSVASVHIIMKSFKGQTEENAIGRATPVIKQLQARTATVDSIY